MNHVDHYITNTHYERATIELTCPECGEAWLVEGHKEYGHWSADNEDDMFCYKCNVAGDQ